MENIEKLKNEINELKYEINELKYQLLEKNSKKSLELEYKELISDINDAIITTYNNCDFNESELFIFVSKLKIYIKNFENDYFIKF
jgi:hypothetical protein